MILVTGASGTIGGVIVRLLAGRGVPVRAMTRDPTRVPAMPGVEVVRADFEDPASLRAAAAGASTLFLLTAPPTPSPHHDLAMLDAAREAGVSRVVRLSAIGSGERVEDGTIIGAWHERADRAVRDSGMAWTVLRPTTFASNSLQWVPAIRAGEPIPNPMGTSRHAVVDPRDVSAVAVEALISTVHTGQTYVLTGPELLSMPEQAAVLERVLGRPVKTVDITLEQAREQATQQLAAHGLDTAFADAYLAALAWARAGHNAVVTDDAPRVLGRPATRFEAWARDQRDAFG